MGLFATLRTSPPPRIEPQPIEPVDLAQTAAAVTLAQDLAVLHDTTVEMTWWSLCNAPPEMDELLATPEGWTAYARYIAHDLGLPAVEYAPEVH